MILFSYSLKYLASFEELVQQIFQLAYSSFAYEFETKRNHIMEANTSKAFIQSSEVNAQEVAACVITLSLTAISWN